MLMYMTYIAHIMGCMWHWLVTFEGEGISWVSLFGVEEASFFPSGLRGCGEGADIFYEGGQGCKVTTGHLYVEFKQTSAYTRSVCLF